MRRIYLIVAVIALLATQVSSQAGSYTIRGRVSATDQEAQEGYFAFDNATMLVVKPGSEIHTYLRSKVGQRVRVTIEPDTGTE